MTFFRPFSQRGLELAASVVKRRHLEIADSETLEAGHLIMMLGRGGPGRRWTGQ